METLIIFLVVAVVILIGLGLWQGRKIESLRIENSDLGHKNYNLQERIKDIEERRNKIKRNEFKFPIPEDVVEKFYSMLKGKEERPIDAYKSYKLLRELIPEDKYEYLSEKYEVRVDLRNILHPIVICKERKND